jgi:hypothetical protein
MAAYPRFVSGNGEQVKEKKSKAILVAGREGVESSEMLRIPYCVDNRLIDGRKVVSPTHQPHFTPQKLFFF